MCREKSSNFPENCRFCYDIGNTPESARDPSRPRTMRTRVKICGITRADDARAAAAQGVDAIGLVFYPQSPRAVTIEQARTICEAVPPFVTIVALFVNPEAGEVAQVLGAVPVDLLQFHGSESPEFCNEFVRPYIKAFAVRDEVDLLPAMAPYRSAAGYLLDTYQPAIHGGSGMTFDWSRIPENPGKPIILAGGLGPDNVAMAVARTHPYAVDVSSGVEEARGIKSAAKIAAFMKGVENGNAS